MRNRLCVAVAAVLMMALLIPSALTETRMMVISDTHYLARELYEGSDLFIRALWRSDGRLTHQSEALMTALVKQVEQIRPDALIVTGDLSFNGERASHEALAEWFRQIESLGVSVWVIPGNHDINSPTARGYASDGWYGTDAADEAAFAQIYADFMLEEESAGFSYLAPISDALCVAMTDVSYYQDVGQTFGLFTAGHRDWLEDVLARARARGAEAITATHHSLVAHTQFSVDSFLMFGSDSMAALARRHGVRLNLSGHLHIQHIASEDGVTDAVLGAFCAWPHRYALVTLDDAGALSYEARSLEDRYLPEGFMDMSRDWFYGIAHDKTLTALAESGLGDYDAERMADFAARFNLSYFSGTYRSDDPGWRADAAYDLWRGLDGTDDWKYMKLVMDEPNGENLYLKLE